MATAIPLAVGLVAGGGAAMMGVATATAITIGMTAMTAAQMLLGPRKPKGGETTAQFTAKEYTARADCTPLPRVYGTVRLPAQMVWFGNYHGRKTRKSASQSRRYPWGSTNASE